MKRSTHHVLPTKDGKWAIKKGGDTKASRVVETQKTAIKIAKQVSKNQKTELLIHRKDGSIREANSYGKDPHPPKDKK